MRSFKKMFATVVLLLALSLCETLTHPSPAPKKTELINYKECMKVVEQLANSQMLLIGRSSKRLWLLTSANYTLYSVPLSSLNQSRLLMRTAEPPTSLKNKWPDLADNGTFTGLYKAKQFASAISMTEEDDQKRKRTVFVFATPPKKKAISLLAYHQSKGVTLTKLKLDGDMGLGGRWISSEKMATFYTAQVDKKEQGRLTVVPFKLVLTSKTQVTSEKDGERFLCISIGNVHVIPPKAKCPSPAPLRPIEHGIEFASNLYLFSADGVLILPMAVVVGGGKEANKSHPAQWYPYHDFIDCDNSSDGNEYTFSTKPDRRWTIIIAMVITVLVVIGFISVCLLSRQHPEPQIIVKKPIPNKKAAPKNASGVEIIPVNDYGDVLPSQSDKSKPISSPGKGGKVSSPKSKQPKSTKAQKTTRTKPRSNKSRRGKTTTTSTKPKPSTKPKSSSTEEAQSSNSGMCVVKSEVSSSVPPKKKKTKGKKSKKPKK